jgi:signal transduction histidine kinase
VNVSSDGYKFAFFNGLDVDHPRQEFVHGGA